MKVCVHQVIYSRTYPAREKNQSSEGNGKKMPETSSISAPLKVPINSSGIAGSCSHFHTMDRHLHEDPEKLKRSRGWANAYELSEDMREKQLQMLERKYGGHIRARRAARIIQHAFRQYCMTRNFEKLRTDKRLSRCSQVCWSDLTMPGSALSLHQRNSLYLPSHLQLTSSTSMHKSKSFNVTVLHEQRTVIPSRDANGVSCVKRRSCTVTATALPAEVNNAEDCCFGIKNSPPPTVDVPSAKFENLLESKGGTGTSNTLNESFQSDGSQEASQWYEHYPTVGDETMSRTYQNTEIKLHGSKYVDGNDESGASPIWKRKSSFGSSNDFEEQKRMSNISEGSEPSGSLEDRESCRCSSVGSDNASVSNENIDAYKVSFDSSTLNCAASVLPNSRNRISERRRKRLYRIGLNLFNKRPDKGIQYLIGRRFVENHPSAVARFFVTRKGLSKRMIGEFLGNLQKQFNMETLSYFASQMDLTGLEIDESLRLYQSSFRMPGEAQKIERLMEAFANQYCVCNPDLVKTLNSPDTIFLLAFAIVMLNTDLHNANIKRERKMKLDDFIRNLRGIDSGEDVDPAILSRIYLRISEQELAPADDHVSQVLKVEQMISGKKPQLALPHRRLVCYCRLYEVPDPNKKEKLGLHQREVFLFNDLLMVTKILTKRKNNVMYSFRSSHPLCGLIVRIFEKPGYVYGISLNSNIDCKVRMYFNARNEHDQTKFIEDLHEAIQEMNEMESLRIEDELQRQSSSQPGSFNRHSNDSGVVDFELIKPGEISVNRLSAPECTEGLKKNALSNSLIDLNTENCGSRLRLGSGSSLDSGIVSIPQQSNSQSSPNSLKSQDGTSSSRTLRNAASSSLFSSMFSKRTKSNSKSSVKSPDELSEI